MIFSLKKRRITGEKPLFVAGLKRKKTTHYPLIIHIHRLTFPAVLGKGVNPNLNLNMELQYNSRP